MPRKPKPFPDPQTQIRRYQRGTLAHHPTRLNFTGFTVGTGNPTTTRPSHAMVALSTLLAQAKRYGEWMTMPYKTTTKGATAFLNILDDALGEKSPVAGISGLDTPAIIWVFSDMTCLLTQVCSSGLRLYPAILYLRTRDHYWTAKFLLGRGQDPQPSLRLTDTPYGYMNDRKRDRAHHHYAPLDLLDLDDEKPCATTGSWKSWARTIKRDVDLFNPVFDALEGHACPPEPQKSVTKNPPQTQSAEPASSWSKVFPHEGISPSLAAWRKQAFQDAAEWIAAVQQTYGETKDIHVRRSLTPTSGCLKILLLPPGNLLPQHGIGRHHNFKTNLIEGHQTALENTFPAELANRLFQALPLDGGVRYYKCGTTLWVDEWHQAVGLASGQLSAHDSILIFSKYGKTDTLTSPFWKALFGRP